MPQSEKQEDRDHRDTDHRGQEETPGAVGYPEPGSGHDDSETTTVDDGPPVEVVDGVPGAFGEVRTDRQPALPSDGR